MTEQEIEKLREKLGGDYSVKRLNGAITVELVDIWKGVEFAECVGNNGWSDSWTVGKIYPVENISNGKINLYNNRREYCPVIEFDYRYHPELVCFKPSTEAAYVEQLKAKAHELYGRINDGDRFELDGVEFRAPIGFELRYVSEHDKLVLDNYMKCPHIYQQGKWAKKIQQAIVTPVEIHSSEPDIVGDQVISTRMKIIHGHISQKSRKDVAYHLAKCLEDYLNKSQ